jgi:hypothetical protein
MRVPPKAGPSVVSWMAMMALQARGAVVAEEHFLVSVVFHPANNGAGFGVYRCAGFH